MQWSRSGAQHTAMFPNGKTTGPSDYVSVRSQPLVFGTAIEGFMSCFDARAGASITSGYTGSTGKKGLIYEGRDLVVMSQAAGAWKDLLSSFLTLAGAWILSVTAYLTAVDSGP